MDLEKPNSFEEEWQRAFDNASLTPPSDMWERIERELDEKKRRRPFLFFLRSPAILSGVAAVLLVVLGGILFFNESFFKTDVAETSKKPNLVIPKKQIETSLPALASKESVSALGLPNASQPQESTVQNKTTKLSVAEKIASTKPQKDYVNIKNLTETKQPVSTAFNENNDNILVNNFPEKIIQTIDNQIFAKDLLANNKANLSLLQSRGFRYFGSRYTLQRSKLVFDVEEAEAPVVAAKDSKFWVGVQSGVAPFNPNIQLGGLNAVALAQADVFAMTSNTPMMSASPGAADKAQGNVLVSQPQNAIRSGFGTNVGVAFGYKISKKWNFESGIRYLRGNSTLQSNTYAFQQNGYVNTFFADYLSQKSYQESKTLITPINTVVADASAFGNRYEYLMIPLQMGYEIKLTKKLGLNLLAGISADIFLQNTIINDNSLVLEKNVINGSSGVYKPLNISGLGGVRASYAVSRHWQLNLGSSYQQSLSSGINVATALQMRLRMLGLNYGVNYQF